MPGILFFIKAMNPDFPELRPQIRLKEPLRPQIGLKEPLRLVRASAELATESRGDRAAESLEALPHQCLGKHSAHTSCVGRDQGHSDAKASLLRSVRETDTRK